MIKIGRMEMICFGLGLAQLALACGQPPAQSRARHVSAGRVSAPIVGGQPEPGYPAVGALVVDGGADCTGTLVAPTVVVTAAHCLVGGNLEGMTFLTAEAVGSERQHRHNDGLPVASWHPHPQYRDADGGGDDLGSAGDVEYDVGVVVLAEASPVAPIAVERAAMTRAWEHRALVFVGYGSTAEKADDGDRRRSVTIPVETVYDTTFSYTSRTANTCYGDSGGPAILTSTSGPVLVGVTSWGDQHCESFGVDTRVDAFAEFIEGFIARR